MKRIVILSCLLLLIYPLFALDIEIEYVDGYLDVKDGSDWIELSAGDSITENDTLRLDEDSLATLTYAGGKLNLTRPGVYPVSNILRTTNTNRGVGSLVSKKLKRLISEPERTRSAVGGVRGAKSVSEVEWMSSEAEELINTGKKLLAEDQMESALETFIEAYDYAEFDEEPEILYYTAYTHYILGNTLEAMRSVDDVEIEEGAYFATDFYILKGQILVDTFAFEDAAKWLREIPEDLIENDTDAFQAVNLLLGTCMTNLGEPKAADMYFSEVIKADPDSPFAEAAQNAR